MERVHYAELTPAEFRARLRAAPVAYLPLGTLEWHGEHLPLGSDGLQAAGFFEELARRAGGVVLPMLFTGPDIHRAHEGRDYYGMDILAHAPEPPRQLDGSAYWLDNDFFEGLLERIMAQLARAGFRVVVAHGHGPSTQAFVGKTQDWRRMGLTTFICWRGDESDGLGIQTDHAAANETSLMMALHGDLVRMDRLDPDPAVSPLGIDGDDPRAHASAEKGRQAIAMQAARMAELLRDALDHLEPR
jgi:creatinine amidohydrolase